MEKNFLFVESASIGYKEPLISNLNLNMNNGELCLLIGDNGAGKTTLIKSLIAQIPLLNGNVYLDHKDIKPLSPKQIAEKVAVVFSKAHIPENYTVTDLISFGKYIHYPFYFELNKEDKLQVEEIINSLKLNEYQNAALRKLSDGNLQKAFIGRALAQNSPFIVLDEPTTHLDENNKIMILNLLRNLARKQNRIILFSSHDWRLAKEFADKIIHLHNGKADFGLTEDILLKNKSLTEPKLFNINNLFSPPEIIAPFLEREMLYSALQKNSDQDLSKFRFSYSENKWKIYYKENIYFAENIENCLRITENINV